jgi:hypothetical protein
VAKINLGIAAKAAKESEIAEAKCLKWDSNLESKDEE